MGKKKGPLTVRRRRLGLLAPILLRMLQLGRARRFKGRGRPLVGKTAFFCKLMGNTEGRSHPRKSACREIDPRTSSKTICLKLPWEKEPSTAA